MFPPLHPQDLRLEILEYLRAHPFAADTLEGIGQWWLPLQHYEIPKDIIQKALDDLISQGLVDYVDTGDGRRIFRLAEHRDKPESLKNGEIPPK
jgi:hypothetical protein